MNARPEVNRDRLSVLLGCVALGYLLSQVIELPSQQFSFRALGSQLGMELSAHWLLTAFVFGLVVTGVQTLFRDHPLCCQGQVRSTLIFWILPGMTAVVTGALLDRIEPVQGWLAVLIGGVIALGVVIAHEYRSLDQEHLQRSGVQLLTTVWVYGLALALLVSIYGLRARALLAGPAVLAATGLLAARFFWSTTQQLGRVILYGAIVGLIMGQAIWALNYWRLAPLPGGLLLLLIFYVATGLTQQALLNQINKRALAEYGLATLLAIVALVALF